MNTFQIDSFAKAHPITAKYYAGCIAADHLPTKKISNKYLPLGMVINSCNLDGRKKDKENDSAQYCHWTAVWLTETTLEYFDSGGSNSIIANKHIKTFIARQKKKIVSNKQQIQGFTSDFCGMFVLTFLYARSLNISINKYLSAFDKFDLEKNDAKVARLFKCCFLKKLNNCI